MTENNNSNVENFTEAQIKATQKYKDYYQTEYVSNTGSSDGVGPVRYSYDPNRSSQNDHNYKYESTKDNYNYSNNSYNNNYANTNYNQYNSNYRYENNMADGNTKEAQMLGTLSLITSIASFPMLGFGVLLAGAGLIFGVMSYQEKPNGLGLAGIIISIIRLLLWIWKIVLGFRILSWLFGTVFNIL